MSTSINWSKVRAAYEAKIKEAEQRRREPQYTASGWPIVHHVSNGDAYWPQAKPDDISQQYHWQDHVTEIV